MKETGEITRIVCALCTNWLETFSIQRKKQESNKTTIITFEKQTTMDMYAILQVSGPLFVVRWSPGM